MHLQNTLLQKLKLKEHYDPNALHDLKDIVQMDAFINELYRNRNNYLENFIKSKFLSYEQIKALVPDHKFESMLKKGRKYIKSTSRSNTFEFNRWGTVCPLNCGIKFYLLVDSFTILPVIFPYNIYIDMNDFVIDNELNMLKYSIRRHESRSRFSQSNDYTYECTLKIAYSTINNELLYCVGEESSTKCWTSGAGEFIKYQKTTT
jgi:hypothetical protein